MNRNSWLILRCKRCVFYRPACSAYGHCKVLEELNMYTLVHSYKACPCWKELNKDELD